MTEMLCELRALHVWASKKAYHAEISHQYYKHQCYMEMRERLTTRIQHWERMLDEFEADQLRREIGK